MEEELRVTAKQMGIHSNNIANLVIEDISLKNFPAKPLEGYFLAHIYWSIYYKFVPRPGSAKGVFPMVVAQPEISPKSWMNTKCADNCLIQHQYGHYLIACWCALEFQQTVNYGYQILSNTTTVDQYKDWCASVFRSTLKKYCAIERLYDQETQHYCDQERQAEWEKKIVSHINEYDKKSKERAKQKIQGQFKQANKFESKRAFSQHKPKKEVNQSSFKPRIPASGYRIRPAGMPIRPIKVA